MTTTDDQKEEVKRRWIAGERGAPIAQALGLTKGQVMGIVNRAGLLNLPQHARPGEVRELPRTDPPLEAKSCADGASEKALAKAEEKPRPPAPKSELSSEPCVWPIGDPGEPGFRFCSKPRLKKHPYCKAHTLMSYRRTNPDKAARKKALLTRRRTTYVIR